MAENDREIVALWTSICSQITGVAEILAIPIKNRKAALSNSDLVKRTTPTKQRHST